MTNKEIAKILREIAAAYSIKDEKKYRFQIIAYQRAADSVEHLTTELADLIKNKIEEKIPGIGPSIMAHLTELIERGKVAHFEEIKKGIPEAVFPLLEIPGFGPKKAYKLVTTLALKNPKTVIEDLYKSAQSGRIAKIPTFGEKSQSDIIRSIEEYRFGKTKTARMNLPYAFELAKKILEYLKKSKDVVQAYPLGSLRRMVSTVGDIDIAVASNNPKKVIEHFISYPGTERIIEKGEKTASILVSGGKQIDLMVQKPEGFGALLQHFTGSKSHNIHLREYALKKGMSLSEYGIKFKRGKREILKTYDSEENFYKALGLVFIPPELREDRGEIEAAERNKLPNLIELEDIKGDLHIHSNYPIEPSHDLGANTMEEMLQKARELGYEYLGFSEHNPSITRHTKNQIYSILKKRFEKIEQLKKSNKYIRIINLLEVDILPNGSLAIDDKAFEYIEAAIVSIHSSFSMGKEAMTDRIITGLSHPKAKILAHPTGRLLETRNGYEVVWDRLFDFVIKNKKALEINAWPERLDLPDVLVKEAKERGVKFVINTDSHAQWQMDNMFYGVSVARRGWVEALDVLNTLDYNEFCSWLNNR